MKKNFLIFSVLMSTLFLVGYSSDLEARHHRRTQVTINTGYAPRPVAYPVYVQPQPVVVYQQAPGYAVPVVVQPAPCYQEVVVYPKPRPALNFGLSFRL